MFLVKEDELRADIKVESVRARHVIVGTLPCVSITSLNQDAKTAKNADSDTLRLYGQPSKKCKKSGVKGSVALMKESFQLGCLCVSRFSSAVVQFAQFGSQH